MSAAKSRRRGRGEGSIYRFREGWAAYVWVTRPDGTRGRKYVYGTTQEQARGEWLTLHQQAVRGPVAKKSPLLKDYLDYWLREVVRPNLRAKVAETYEMHVRLHIAPWIGHKRLDKLMVRDARTWLNELAQRCQCCAQGKDAARPVEKQRCCAIGRCCGQKLSRRCGCSSSGGRGRGARPARTGWRPDTSSPLRPGGRWTPATFPTDLTRKALRKLGRQLEVDADADSSKEPETSPRGTADGSRIFAVRPR